MLRKMYLVSADDKFQNKHPAAPSYKKIKTKRRRLPLRQKRTQRPYDKWFKSREQIKEQNVKREALIKQFAEFLSKVLPKNMSQQQQVGALAAVPPFTQGNIKDEHDEAEAEEEERKNFGEIANPYLDPYLSNTSSRLLDTQYGIRREGDNFKIGNSNVTVDDMSNIYVRGRQFEGTKDLWKLLTRKDVSYDSIDKNALQTYKTILEMTNGHLEGYRDGGNIQTSRSTKFKAIIAKLFPEAKLELRQKWTVY